MISTPDATLFSALFMQAFQTEHNFFDPTIYSRRDMIADHNIHPDVEPAMRATRAYGPGFGNAAALLLTNQVRIETSPTGGVRVEYTFAPPNQPSAVPVQVTIASETSPSDPTKRNRLSSASLNAHPEAHPLLTLVEGMLHPDLYPFATNVLRTFARYVRYPITPDELYDLSKREASGTCRDLLHKITDYAFEDCLNHIPDGAPRIQLVSQLQGQHDFTPLTTGQIAAHLGMTNSSVGAANNEQRLTRAFRQGMNALLVGPPATLKTSAVKDVAVTAGCWMISMRGAPSVEDRDFIGAIMPSEKGPRWVDGPLARAFTLGASAPGIILIDEVLRYQPDTMGSLITVMDELSYTEARLILEPPLRHKGSGLLTPEQRDAARDLDQAVNTEVESIIAENLPDRDARYYMLELPNSEILFAPTRNISFMLTTNWGEDHAQVASNIDGALRSRINMVLEFVRPNPEKALRIYQQAADGNAHLVQIATTIDDLFFTEMQDEECLFDRSTDLRKIKAFIEDAQACLTDGMTLTAAIREAAQTVLVSHVCPRDVRGNLEQPSLKRFDAIIDEALAMNGL